MKVKSVCVPLDPDDCGSVISGYVRYPELIQKDYGKKLWYINTSASASLSDCSRVIQWSLSGSGGTEYNTVKIDRAIEALQKLRKHCVKAQAEFDAMEKERKARNLILDPDNNE
jgi:hypothetical protein